MELLCIQSQEHPELPIAELKAVMECENIDAIIDVITEGLLCCAVTFFTVRCFSVLGELTAGPTADELVSLLIVIGVLLMGLEDIAIGGISVGRIL